MIATPPYLRSRIDNITFEQRGLFQHHSRLLFPSLGSVSMRYTNEQSPTSTSTTPLVLEILIYASTVPQHTEPPEASSNSSSQSQPFASRNTSIRFEAEDSDITFKHADLFLVFDDLIFLFGLYPMCFKISLLSILTKNLRQYPRHL